MRNWFRDQDAAYAKVKSAPRFLNRFNFRRPSPNPVCDYPPQLISIAAISLIRFGRGTPYE